MTIELTPLWIVLIFIFSARQLWLYFVAAMRLKMVRDAGKLSHGQRIFGYSVLFEGLLIDLVFHLTFGTLVFLEIPPWGEWTLSARLWRLSNSLPSWRQRLALYFRVKLLDSMDPSPEGVHRG